VSRISTATASNIANLSISLDLNLFACIESSHVRDDAVAGAILHNDKQGRLRAEWDPRPEHPLKMVYGYDAEGHMTALTPPGRQPWAFTYGTIVGDSNTGRLLKVTRAQPTAGASEEKVKEKLHE
jgi:hypothetical protein